MLVLFSSVTLAYATTETGEIKKTRKYDEEKKAVQFQKEKLHFDYLKMHKKDKGFKTGIPAKEKPKIKIQQIISLKPVKVK